MDWKKKSFKKFGYWLIVKMRSFFVVFFTYSFGLRSITRDWLIGTSTPNLPVQVVWWIQLGGAAQSNANAAHHPPDPQCNGLVQLWRVPTRHGRPATRRRVRLGWRLLSQLFFLFFLFFSRFSLHPQNTHGTHTHTHTRKPFRLILFLFTIQSTVRLYVKQIFFFCFFCPTCPIFFCFLRVSLFGITFFKSVWLLTFLHKKKRPHTHTHARTVQKKRMWTWFFFFHILFC